MKIIFTLLFSIVTLYTSHFYTHTIVNGKTVENLDRIKLSIKEHIINQFKNKGNYNELNYGELTTIKPLEIQELDKLITLKNQLPSMKKNYGTKLDSIITLNDSNIVRQKREIRVKKIFHYYKINHLFTISYKGINTLYEFDFFLYPNYKIKDVSFKIKTEITPTEKINLIYFIKNQPLIEHDNQSNQNHINNKMHKQLSDALINAGDNKDVMLHQVLKLVKFIRKHNKFDADVFCASQLKEWVLTNEPYKQDYRSGLFTRLKETEKKSTTDSSSTNTIMYHKLSYQNNTSQKTNCALSFEFDANYLIIEIKEYKKDYDKFF